MNCKLFVRFGVLLGSVASLSLAQDQPAVIRSDVHVVEVSVIATGSKGLPVSGLSASDFRIFDNGKEQTIATFEELDSRSAPGQAQLPPNIYSNRLPAAGALGKTVRPRVLSAILLDNINTLSRFQTTSRRAVESILEQLDPAECVAIYALGSRFQVIHDFSCDRTSLLARLKAFHGETPEGSDLMPDQDNDLDGVAPPDPVEKTAFDTARAMATFDALESIANYMKGVPGRKNLLWVSEAFPMEVGDSQRVIAPSALNPVNYIAYRNFGPEMKRAMQALNNADVSVYPIGAHGLSKGPNPFKMLAPDPHLFTKVRDMDSVASGVHTMVDVADDTGGKAFADNNDLALGVRKALDDSRVTYWMTYYPKSFVANGEYHRISVRSVRPGVQLRFRQGYFPNAAEKDRGAGVEDRVTRALSSPLDASEIGLRAGAGGSAGGEFTVAIDVDARDLALTRNGDRWTGDLIMIAAQTGATGKQYDAIRQTANLNLTEETYRRVLERGLRLNMKLKRETAAVAVRIGVGEQGSSRVGSLSVPLPDSGGLH